MGYRDELEALRARNAELEDELVAARRELRERGRASDDARNVIVGGPTRLHRELELDGELDDEGLELLVGELRQDLGEIGRTEQLGQTLTWTTALGQSGRIVEVTCQRRRGKTRILIRENLRQLVGGLFGGGLGGGGGGGMGFVVPLGLRFPAAIPFLVVGWFVFVYAVVRSIYGRLANKRAASLDRLVIRLERVLRSELPAQQAGNGLRVASLGPNDRDREAAAEAELEAEAEAGAAVEAEPDPQASSFEPPR